MKKSKKQTGLDAPAAKLLKERVLLGDEEVDFMAVTGALDSSSVYFKSLQFLTGKTSRRSSVKGCDMLAVLDEIKKGLPRNSFDVLKKRILVSDKKLGNVVHISPSTLSRRGHFTPEQSERILRVGAVFQRAVEVFNNEDAARLWLTKPRENLRNKTPLDFCDTEFGAVEVMDLLGRIDHSVY